MCVSVTVGIITGGRKPEKPPTEHFETKDMGVPSRDGTQHTLKTCDNQGLGVRV